MNAFIFSLHAVAPIFAVLLISGYLRKIGLITPAFLSCSDKLTFRLLLPILLFQEVAKTPLTASALPLPFLLFCVLSTTASFLLIWGLSAWKMRAKESVGAFVQGAFRSSLAIFGVAFAVNMYGDAGLIPLVITVVVPLYNIYSVIVLTVHAPTQTGRTNSIASCFKDICTNPLILAIGAGLICSALSIPIPKIVDHTLNYFSAMAMPLALLAIGGGFEGKKAIAKVKLTALASFLKLFLLPAILLSLAYAMGFRNQELVALLVMSGTPGTVTGYLMCKNMGGDAVLSSSIIVATTALSALSLTFFLFVLRALHAI